MMRRILLALMLVSVLMFAAMRPEARRGCSGSSPNWTTTPDRASVEYCLTHASAGDTITVSAGDGTETWATGITFTRGVNLIGPGATNLTISGAVDSLLWWNLTSTPRNAHDTLKVQGFTFDGLGASSNTGLIRLGWSDGGEYVTAVIVDNVFQNLDGRGVYVWGRVHGVIARNTFDRLYIALGCYGDNHLGWAVDSQAFGDANQIYFENNLIQYSGTWTTSYRAVSGGNGGQCVIRYNDWNMATSGGSGYQLWELHGLQSMFRSDGVTRCSPETGDNTCDPNVAKCESYSVLSSEWYGNNVYGVGTGNEWMQHRGGWMLFHHNKYAATSGTTTGIHFLEYACDSCQQYVPTYGPFTMHISNTYVWNNFDQTTRVGMTSGGDYCKTGVPGGGPYEITEDRDYFSDKYATFDGTSGVGCGNAAAFAKLTTCTTGVAYWVTDQSCTSLTGMVGRNPATPISGKLYKCKATNTWQSAGEAYTPYEYPHYLAGTLPSAPTNVRIR